MVSKRPSERPDWNEVLRILSQPPTLIASDHPSVKAAVEAVIVRKKKEEELALKSRHEETEREKQLALYRYSCDALLRELRPAVEQFNRDFQHGQITYEQDFAFATYRIPSGRSITVSFFEPQILRMKIRGGEVIGGGWIEFREEEAQIWYC